MDFDYLRFLAGIGATHIHPHEKRATDILIRELKLADGQRVLELGCGTGGTMVRIGGRYQVTLYGLDQLEEMLATAAKRIRLTGLSKRVYLLKGTLAALPFPAAGFDRIYAESVLGILDSQTIELVLDEMYRVLDKVGIIVLNDAIWKRTVTAEQAQTINHTCIRDFGLPLASAPPWNVTDWHALFRQHAFQVDSFLIDDYLKTADNTIQINNNWRDLASDTLTRGYKFIGYTKSGLRLKKQQYDRLLQQHQNDGRFIESRIFVLTKS